MALFSILISFAIAGVPRIESRSVDLSKASKVYLRPGLVSVMELPQNIIEVRVGNPNDLKVLISQVSPKELTIFFKNSHVSATNLIVRADRRVYVFDIVPSTNRHQDFIKVRGAFGQPEISDNFELKEAIQIAPSPIKTSPRDLKIIEKVSL